MNVGQLRKTLSRFNDTDEIISSEAGGFTIKMSVNGESDQFIPLPRGESAETEEAK